VSDIISEVVFGPFWRMLPGLGPLGQCFSLEFSLETRLKSNCFELLIVILVFLVQKLWSKINKLINYLFK